jgi:hypothetical protein
MKTLRRFLLFVKLDRRTAFLFIEAYLTLALARVLLFIPFAKLAPQLGTKAQETSDQHSQPDAAVMIKHIASTVNISSRYTLWDSKCLVRAIAGMKMLERRRIDCTLYLGTAKDESSRLIAHAWLRSGPLYVTGADVMNRFTIVEKFAKTVKPRKG